MLYFHKEKLVILCQPKTGTTALHEAIGSDAAVVLNTPPQLKHMTYRKFMQVFAPWLERDVRFPRRKYTFVAVMREPLDWLGSWYRYSSRDALAKPKQKNIGRYTGDISFDQFLQATLLPRSEAPAYAKMAGPCSISLDQSGAVGVDYLFRYTDLDNMVDFVSDRLQRDIKLPLANISAKKELEASQETIDSVRQKLAFEFNVYDKLRSDGVVPDELRKKNGKADDSSLTEE